MNEVAMVHGVEEALRAIRARAAAIGLRREDIDLRAGLTGGHAGKLLCVPPVKRASAATIFLLAGAVGWAVCFVEDPKALARAKRAAKERKLTRPPEQHWRVAKGLGMMHELAVQNGKIGGLKRFALMTPEEKRRH